MMKQKILYLLVGLPASGKSTWAKTIVAENPSSAWISRDVIRFRTVRENEEYFSKEKYVFQEFVNEINKSLKKNEITIADATHLNEASRNKLLSRLDVSHVKIIPVNFYCYIDTLLERNARREGRACVPESVIRNMGKNFQPATRYEKFPYEDILMINSL